MEEIEFLKERVEQMEEEIKKLKDQVRKVFELAEISEDKINLIEEKKG